MSASSPAITGSSSPSHERHGQRAHGASQISRPGTRATSVTPEERIKYAPVELSIKFHESRSCSERIVIDDQYVSNIPEGTFFEVLSSDGNPVDYFQLEYADREVKKRLFSGVTTQQMSILTGSPLWSIVRNLRSVKICRIDQKDAEADLLTFYIRDTHLTRSDMWRIPAMLSGKPVTEGQAVEFIGSIKINVSTIHRNGKRVKLALVGPDTRSVFRSQSVRYLIFLQMSTEMWFFDESGESYFHKVINSYLPDLFRQWRKEGVHHLISIVMFTSVDLNSSSASLPHGVRSRNVRDHFRIVVDRMRVSDWASIMETLRREFAEFQENVLVRQNDKGNSELSGAICPAIKGNILEAINFAATQTSMEINADDSLRGYVQTIVVSPGSGLFDVEADLLQRTTQNLMAASVSIDLVCLTRMPLHIVPLFRYRDAYSNVVHCMPHWIDVAYWKSISTDGSNNAPWVPRCRIYEIQMMGIMENELSSISIDYLPSISDAEALRTFMTEYDENALKSVIVGTDNSTEKMPNFLGSSGRLFRDDNPLWTTILNPSNPSEDEKLSSSAHGTWKHIYPRKSSIKSVKWKSVISPASLPITTEVFPSPEEFYGSYLCQSYDVIIKLDSEDIEPEKRDPQAVLRAMVSYRVGMGFQITVGPIVADIESQSKNDPNPSRLVQEIPESCEGVRIYLSSGTEMHRIAYINANKVMIQIFHKVNQKLSLEQDVLYRPLVKTTSDKDYQMYSVRFPGARQKDTFFKEFDLYLAGDDLPKDRSEFYRTRIVLIPTELQNSRLLYNKAQTQAKTPKQEELTPEEIRLDGLRKLSDKFYSSQYFSPEETRHEQGRKKKVVIPELKFYTGDLSAFITQLVRTTGEDDTVRKKDSIIMNASERFDRRIKLAKLAEEMQGEHGVKLVDRRWHWKLHQHCFVGSELVAWLLENFKDIDTPEAAVEYGNELMRAKLFHHVELRHQFLDGHYFYQLNPDFRNSASLSVASQTSTGVPQRMSWLRGAFDIATTVSTGNGSDGEVYAASVPLPHAPLNRSVSGSSVQSDADSSIAESDELANSTMSLDSDNGRRGQQFANTPYTATRRVELSKLITIDVDPFKKSYRRELVRLHYDRLHNPESCYHLMLEWMNTTPKFIDETVASWSRICDKSGLKLVEVPIVEAVALANVDPFMPVTRVKFIISPPITKTTDPVLCDPLFYQKQVLAELGYVLDMDAKATLDQSNLDIEVIYSWGRPHFQHSQYIHKTGATLAELDQATGEFIFVRNPVGGVKFVQASSTGASSNSATSSAHQTDAEAICSEAVDFITSNPFKLKAFFHQVLDEFSHRRGIAVPFNSPPADMNVYGSSAASNTTLRVDDFNHGMGNSFSSGSVVIGTYGSPNPLVTDEDYRPTSPSNVRQYRPPPSDTRDDDAYTIV
ncbi:uncharacterized protein V1518DRAFT_417735 [Limtongia smithiae]|uniref:uncharacterized protein n=1 Tax=Limtongia smithiae TaxID=1125753 RepID=UPI0034CD5DA4